MISKIVIPDYFTCREGGDWIVYTEDGWKLETLEKAVIGLPWKAGPGIQKDSIVLIAADTNGRRYHVHSLRFSKESPDADCYARWDTWNGWTEEL
jgi:hypothetical protein